MSDETFLVLNNEVLEKFILYTDDTAKENYKMSQQIENFQT